MERRKVGTVAAAVLGLLGLGCLASAPVEGGDQREKRESGRIPDGAIVVDSRTLSQTTGSLLAAMSVELAVMEVAEEGAESGRCPSISLRGPATARGLSNPLIYVDGSRTGDTCVLDSLNAGDVERVEVYPTGHTDRSGYANHAHGLILIFMRDN